MTVLSLQEFGKQLLETNDLDPVYPMLVYGNPERLERWLLGYWMFYHCGVASRLSEAEDFWGECRKAYDEKWPRGTERRHFRGESARKAIEVLSARTPESIVTGLVSTTFSDIKRETMRLPQFGPWIAWKVADMVERVMRQPVDFSNSSLHIYRDPARAVALYLTGDKLAAIPEQQFTDTVNELVHQFRDYAAPPTHDRPVNVQEVETILCKWKSHVGGHYPMGKDTREISHGLTGWGATAERLKETLHVHCK